MNIVAKFKEVLVAVSPIILFVGIIHFFFVPLPAQIFWTFLGSILFLLGGMSLFLHGVEIGLQKFGHLVGALLANHKRLLFFLFVGFSIGFMVTVAEPDLHVLARQLHQYTEAINPWALIISVALGSGIFTLFGLLHRGLGLRLRTCLLISYGLIFAFLTLTDYSFIPISFDSGGVTTGPLTVPFVLAMGLGLAASESSHGGEEEGFGLVSLMSVGPIVAVLLLGVIKNVSLQDVIAQNAVIAEPLAFKTALWLEAEHALKDTLYGLTPLLLLFLFFQSLYFKLPWKRFSRVILGFIFSILGLTLFLTGVHLGFVPVASYLGEHFAGQSSWFLPVIGFCLGLVIVLAEPSVWILTEQIEVVTDGKIPRRKLLYSLALAVGMAVLLAMLRLQFAFPLLYVLLPGYVLALLFTRFSTPLFSAIAFDSGGVASGVMTSAFLLPFVLGAAVSLARNPILDAFGLVAMVALAPLLVIQVLGIIAARTPSLEEKTWQLLQKNSSQNQLQLERELKVFHAHQRRSALPTPNSKEVEV